ncbi:MAG: phosphate acyltransferase PlsX [Sandaracinaceae bacterium]
MTTVALDAMGSDLGPQATVAGGAAATLSPEAPDLILVGDLPTIRRNLLVNRHDPAKVEVVHANDVVTQDDPATAAVHLGESSISVAAQLVRKGDADVLVSAGNTGAVVLASARHFQRLPGVDRAALGAVYPTERRRGDRDDPFSLILDAGLTLEVTADDLVAFAVMGSAYAARISKNERPRVALLNIGSEPGKGTRAICEAFGRLEGAEGLDFIGNIEGTDIPKGTADVVVTAGFTGNIVLKMLEGVAETAIRLGRYAGDQSLRYKAGLALLAPAARKLRDVTDWQQYGGAPILGFDHLVIKAHGRSTARAITNAVKVASRAARTGLVDAMRTGLEARPGQAASGEG